MLNKKIKVGSVCSGIEAASLAISGLNFEVSWLSEIADFPSKLLSEKYPNVQNLGDLSTVPQKLSENKVSHVDLICGGTPCQAFSLAGKKNGLNDDRGNLTLKFLDIVDKNDEIRKSLYLPKSLVLWENVEGVLKDKTNAFGCLISKLLSLPEALQNDKWPEAGAIHGVERNVAWRVLDTKYFGLPQQRKRLYMISSGKEIYPENILFDKFPNKTPTYLNKPLSFIKNGHKIKVFRDYSDCLYASYGTKWNGNAAAYNGSLFVSQNDKLRRLTPLECERLMGFPDNYTNLFKSKPTVRYQAIGNSWAVPVVHSIARKIEKEMIVSTNSIFKIYNFPSSLIKQLDENCIFYKIPTKYNKLFKEELYFNGSKIPENPVLGNIEHIIETEVEDKFYISSVGCAGILRRAEERKININASLKDVLILISNTMSSIDIEKKSRIQQRGNYIK